MHPSGYTKIAGIFGLLQKYFCGVIDIVAWDWEWVTLKLREYRINTKQCTVGGVRCVSSGCSQGHFYGYKILGKGLFIIVAGIHPLG